jgi:carbamoyl-phosphate synthase large subunit
VEEQWRLFMRKVSLKTLLKEAFKAAEENPILIDKFIDHAMEVDVDAISDGKQVHVAGIMQHIEEAGIHFWRLCV